MSKLRRKRISFIARLRNYFITGIVVLVPIGITLYLTTFFISISSKLIPQGINPNSYLPFAIPGLEILLSVIFITLVGGLSLSFIGKKISPNSSLKNPSAIRSSTYPRPKSDIGSVDFDNGYANIVAPLLNTRRIHA